MNKTPQKLAVLVSGSGTLLDCIVAADIPVALVVADRPCAALDKAKGYGIATELVHRTDFSKNFDRDAFSSEVTKLLQKHGITLISMAGWQTVLTKPIFDVYQDHIINNHPALIPGFKGGHTVRDALEYGVKVTGCTIHIANEEIDDGKILAQEAVSVLPDDTEETLHARIKQVEYRLLPQVLKELMG